MKKKLQIISNWTSDYFKTTVSDFVSSRNSIKNINLFMFELY